MVQNIASQDDRVSVEETESDGTVQLSITCAKEDIGRIIGKKGKIIKALRRVLGIVAAREDKRVYITMNDPASLP